MKLKEELGHIMEAIIKHPIWFMRSSSYRFANRMGWIKQHQNTMADQKKDHFAPFDEFPACAMCESTSNSEMMIVGDGSRIVACDQCGLWYTSPRINENVWNRYLKTVTERGVEFTNNRINYGVALTSNIKYVPPYWRTRRTLKNKEILDVVEKYVADRGKLHDVGCGVGFLMQDALRNGWKEASGNELNAYACQTMKEKLGLTVYNCALPQVTIPRETMDAVTMTDYIEHTYQPLLDLKKSYDILKKNGVLYVQTFHLDCKAFVKNGRNWNMLFWNHVYHFTKESLEDMIKSVGFEIVNSKADYNSSLVNIVARKPKKC